MSGERRAMPISQTSENTSFRNLLEDVDQVETHLDLLEPPYNPNGISNLLLDYDHNADRFRQHSLIDDNVAQVNTPYPTPQFIKHVDNEAYERQNYYNYCVPNDKRNYEGVRFAAPREALSPEFVAPLKNQTVTIGRDATFECHIRNLGGYRIGWVYVNTREIQAIHDHVITPNPRVSVSQQNNKTWSLHIKEVEERDRGLYMCQINTDPMQDQMAYLNVVVPPDIVDDGTSSDQNVNEGGNVWLTCKAKGFPKPTITWKREHGDEISIKDSSDMKIHKCLGLAKECSVLKGRV
ncbi:unnamed protein product [Bemisia tabaci]|uniref:Ig-like domain-containing protein n=1 Tax=Bemisia tabaci TaxID=7038 RepID=A0A9P0F702_BEMTA|nr:unnamed protein product [Bemisia tabaci]